MEENGAGKGTRWTRSPLWRVVRGALTVYLAVCLLVFLFQRRLQYFPDASPVPRPGGERHRDLEEVELRTEDGLRLGAWYWPGERPETLLIFHGNAGHRGHRLWWLDQLHEMGFGLFALDYRGYGGSEGSPTEAGLYRDGEAAIAWLQERAPGPIVYLGESLGSAVAIEMAHRRPPAALIVQSAFPSALAVARRVYFFLPVGLLMKDTFECIRRAPGLSCPVLSIHGESDREIPVDLGRKLFEAFAEPREWLLVAGAGHNDLVALGGRTYLEAIERFVSRYAER